MTTTNGTGAAMVTSPVRADLSIRFTPEQEQIILETCCGGASKSEAHALLSIAEARGLNPILGECYFVKRYDGQKKREVWSVQASIDSFRIKAEQTGVYAGQDEPEYEYDDKGRLLLARVRVYRKDWPRPAIGVARWSEYVQTTREGKPTRFWEQMPHNQLAKCAEALALRKAFPAVLAKLYTAEEMAQAENPEPAAPRLNGAPAPRELAAAPSADKQAEVFAKFGVNIDVAETTAALNRIASYALRAHNIGDLSDGHFASIKSAIANKRKIVQGPAAPEPPPSGPSVTDDLPYPPMREPGEEG